MENILLYIILFAPLVSAALSYFLTKKWAGETLVGFSLLVLLAAIMAWFKQPVSSGFDLDWILAGNQNFSIGLYYDQLA
ncbi:hypothetical protein, partial [Reichenbachiella sp.]